MTLSCQPLTPEAFAPFGDVLECAGLPDKIINAGLCARFHNRARLDIEGGHIGLSLFLAEARSLPYTLDLMERHPLGSQAFLPMTEHPFLVTVAPDADGRPGAPHAFLTAPGQGINIARNIWHGVLTPLAAPGRFAVIDYVGTGENLQEVRLEAPIIVTD